MLLRVLAERGLSVTELSHRVTLSQSALSQHLAVLRNEQLVSTRLEAQTIYYSVVDGVDSPGSRRVVHCASGNRRDCRPFPLTALQEVFAMTTPIDKLVFRFAGLFVLASLLLAHYHSAHWLWFTAFVGANLLQASFTGFCPLASILKKLGAPAGAAFGVARQQ